MQVYILIQYCMYIYIYTQVYPMNWTIYIPLTVVVVLTTITMLDGCIPKHLDRFSQVVKSSP